MSDACEDNIRIVYIVERNYIEEAHSEKYKTLLNLQILIF